jgi:hypothetical protein
MAFRLRRRAAVLVVCDAPGNGPVVSATWLARRLMIGLLAAVLAVPLPLVAQQAPAPAAFRAEELEQIAAPVALYPDPLLAQLLMAATYPLEVVLADRFVQANPTLKGDALNEAVRAQGWDDSVKSLAPFPQILRMMSERLEWTQKLGDAFLGQQAELMDAVQRLRARAMAQGTLRSTEQHVVTVEGPPLQQVVSIQPASPAVVYVPMYSPAVVYGPWPYPAYPPYYYYPPGWAATAFFTFGVGIAVGWTLWGICDWHHHHVHVHVDHYRHFSHKVNHEGRRDHLERRWDGPRDRDRFSWQHDPQHRRGVNYRDAVTRERFGRPPSPQAPAREPFRGREERDHDGRDRDGRDRGVTPSPPRGRETPRAAGERRAPDSSQPAPRPSPEPRRGLEQRPAPPGPELHREPEVFRGLGSGRDVQGYSTRGRDSRQAPAPGVRSAPPSGAPRTAPPPRAPQGGQRDGTRGSGSQGGGTRR